MPFPHSKRQKTRSAVGSYLCFVLLMCGCKVGPDFIKPQTEYLQRQWSDQANVRFIGQPVDERVWWQAFNDPTLDHLIAQSLANNLDLKQAGQRILEARALRQVAAGNLYPQQQSLNAGYRRIGISENDANFVVVPGFFRTLTGFDSFSTGFSAAWELDFWGKYRRIIESADANVCASMAAYDLAKVLLIGEVANSYINLRTVEHRIVLAKKNIEIQNATLELTELKLNAGTAVKLDYHQSKANLAQTESVLPTLEILRRQANHELCVLLGQVPEDIYSASPNFGKVPQPPQSIALTIPNDLLRRRPDIQIAERELAAQCARIGIAEADFYPQLSLTGTLGLSSQNFSDLFRSSSLVGTVGPAASWNILNYGRIKNRVIAEQEAFERLRLAYHNTVLKAYQESQDSQAAFINYWDRMEDLEEAAQNAAAAVSISQVAFKEGATDYNRVYLLQSELVQIQDSVADNQGKIAQSLVNLYVSMGGGWDYSGPPCFEQVPAQQFVGAATAQSPDKRLREDFARTETTTDGPSAAYAYNNDGHYVHNNREPLNVPFGNQSTNGSKSAKEHDLSENLVNRYRQLSMQNQRVSLGNQGNHSIVGAPPRFQHQTVASAAQPLQSLPHANSIGQHTANFNTNRPDRDPNQPRPSQHLVPGNPGPAIQSARVPQPAYR